MKRVQIHYDNAVDKDETVFPSFGSWVSTNPLTNLKHPYVHKFAQSTDVTTASTKFRVDLGSTQTFRGIFVTHGNFTAAAQYKITLFSDAFTTVAEATVWSTIAGYPEYDPDVLGVSIWHVFATAKSARYIQIEFDDTTNPAGFLRIGRLFIGTCYEAPKEPSEGSSEGIQSNTLENPALGGADHFVKNTPKRIARVRYARVPSTEFPAIRRLRRISGVDKQVVIIPDSDDATNFHERNFVGRLAELPALELLVISDALINFNIIEVVP